jgi:signal transduction histidine kinase
MTPTIATHAVWRHRWQRFSTTALRLFHSYASWLVSISWRRFIVLSVLLVICAAILQSLPPFSWSVTETIEDTSEQPKLPSPDLPAPPAPPATPASGAKGMDINIQIDEKGIRITPRPKGSGPTASAGAEGVTITVPADTDEATIRQAAEEAKAAIREAIEAQREAAQTAAEAARDAAEAARDAAETARQAAEDAQDVFIPGPSGKIRRTRHVHWGDFLTDLSLLWILASTIVKATYKGRMQAEVKAAQAAETAEAESLKRQVVEARMAAMQAQVEPHFLFNTLASIDHLIEVDPARASQMQKNLIALLRASMPTMREANGQGASQGGRELGRELAVIRPYLEILKVRMEERLVTEIDMPDGLLSAEFPSMMIQTLVENAIKHGLEPKAEGGSLKVKAEIVHGKLQVRVADTGLGFGKAATAGTGVGLANIRERLQLLYGGKASLTVAENQPCGTVVTITVPYRTVEGATA